MPRVAVPAPRYSDHIKRIVTTIDARADEMSEWQRIESAPKDGRRLLAVVDGQTRVIAYGKTSHVPIWGWCLADQGAEDFDICSPDSWMPLPAPPKPEAP